MRNQIKYLLSKVNWSDKSIKLILIALVYGLIIVIAIVKYSFSNETKTVQTLNNIEADSTSQTKNNTSNQQKNIVETKKDITKTTMVIFNSIGDNTYSAKVVDGYIDGSNTLHIAVTQDGLTTNAMVMMYESFGLPRSRALIHTKLVPFFYSVKKFYNKFPEATDLKMYFVKSSTKVADKYGNDIKQEYEILTRYGMTKETVNKINWNYVKNELENDVRTNDGNTFINMLDDHEDNAGTLERD
jgi:hypothetical protein